MIVGLWSFLYFVIYDVMTLFKCVMQMCEFYANVWFHGYLF